MQAPVLVCEQGPGGMAKDRLAESKGPGGERAGDWGVGACGQKLFPAPFQGTVVHYNLVKPLIITDC